MNFVDYLFENTASLAKPLLLGLKENTSYSSINQDVTKLAHYLQNQIGKGKKILLISPNNSFFIKSYLGIIKSGNICVPLNPAIEQTNLDFIAAKTDASLSIVAGSILNKLTIRNKVISEIELNSIIETQNIGENDKSDFNETQIAEIIFTSGSTSIPKGVMLSHKNLIANTNSIIQYLDLNENDIIQVVLPFFYCYGLSLLHTHLRVGGQLLLNNNFILLGTTIDNFNKYKCTGFAGVPSHFQILLRKTELFKKTEFPTLKYVTQAGGKLPNVFISEFNESFPEIKFFVMYGQTEATARLSYLPPELLIKKIGSLGKGIPDVELKVVNSNGDAIQPSETGEIIARGDNIMTGYFEDETETSNTLKNGWLYTGDLATIDEDGYIYLTARKKEIIKVGGQRVSPKEIEEVIDLIPGVVDCTVEGLQDDLMGEAIKSTIIINELGKNLTPEIVQKFCSERLSHHKIPTVIEFRESMEVNSTGKKIKSTIKQKI
jgi:acyl-CoA synthetase (AMP-forming)/AMP-acid ligase II